MRIGYHLKRVQDGLSSIVLARDFFSRDQWTFQELAAFQHQRLQSVVKHAVNHSGFYRDLYAHIDPHKPVPLEQLPVLDKKTMMDNFDRVVTDPQLKLSEVEDHLTHLKRDEYYLSKYRVLSTGGSSGLTGIFVYSRKESGYHTCRHAEDGPLHGSRDPSAQPLEDEHHRRPSSKTWNLPGPREHGFRPGGHSAPGGDGHHRQPHHLSQCISA